MRARAKSYARSRCTAAVRRARANADPVRSTTSRPGADRVRWTGDTRREDDHESVRRRWPRPPDGRSMIASVSGSHRARPQISTISDCGPRSSQARTSPRAPGSSAVKVTGPRTARRRSKRGSLPLLQETLTNIARHAQATQAQIRRTIGRAGGHPRFAITGGRMRSRPDRQALRPGSGKASDLVCRACRAFGGACRFKAGDHRTTAVRFREQDL